MYNRRDNQFSNGRDHGGYGGGASYQSGFGANVPVVDNFQQINNLDYEIENIREQRRMIEQQQEMLEQQQRFQLQRNDQWDSGKDSFGAGSSQISVWDQPPTQFSGNIQESYGGGRQNSSYTSSGSYGRRDDRNRNTRGSTYGNNSGGGYSASRSSGNSRSSYNTPGRGEKRSAPAPYFAEKRARPDSGPVLRRGAELTHKQKGRIEVSLGQIVKSIKERFPDKAKTIPWAILKDTVRKRLKTVLTGKPVGHPDEVVAHYRDLYPEDEDKALIVYAEQKQLEKGPVTSTIDAIDEEDEKVTRTPKKEVEKANSKNPAVILHKLVKQRLELMLTRAYVEDLQETAEKYKPQGEQIQEEPEKAEKEVRDDQKDKRDGRLKPRRKIPINVVKDAEENKYDEFMHSLEEEPHDYVDKVLLDYVRKDLPSMRDLMNAILLNGMVPWRLRQGTPWEKYNPDLLVRPNAFYMTWVCSPELPTIESVKKYLAEGGYDVVAVKRPWRGLFMYVVLNKKEEFEKLLEIKNIKIEECDIVMESSSTMKSNNREATSNQAGDNEAQTTVTDAQTQEKQQQDENTGDQSEQTQEGENGDGNEKKDLIQNHESEQNQEVVQEKEDIKEEIQAEENAGQTEKVVTEDVPQRRSSRFVN